PLFKKNLSWSRPILFTTPSEPFEKFMLDQLLTQFLDHLRYERNVSAHTLRNYESDLRQFFEYIAAADDGKHRSPPISQIDHLTIREWLSTLHSDHKKKT